MPIASTGTNHTKSELPLEDKEAFATLLAETFEPREVVRLLTQMGLRYSDLALALNVHPRTVRAWVEDNDRDPARQRDGVLALKALVLFLLRRGVLNPRQVALWLVEPNEELGFRRPLAVLAERGLNEIVDASGAFTRPEPMLDEIEEGVAAGAVGRDRGADEHDHNQDEAVGDAPKTEQSESAL